MPKHKPNGVLFKFLGFLTLAAAGIGIFGTQREQKTLPRFLGGEVVATPEGGMPVGSLPSSDTPNVNARASSGVVAGGWRDQLPSGPTPAPTMSAEQSWRRDVVSGDFSKAASGSGVSTLRITSFSVGSGVRDPQRGYGFNVTAGLSDGTAPSKFFPIGASGEAIPGNFCSCTVDSIARQQLESGLAALRP